MSTAACLLDPGFDLTLRPMRYPRFYEMYRGAIKNTWTRRGDRFSDRPGASARRA